MEKTGSGFRANFDKKTQTLCFIQYLYNIYDATYEDNSCDIQNQLQKKHISRPFLFILNLLSLSITMMFFL
jgi:hypothetical protein